LQLIGLIPCFCAQYPRNYPMFVFAARI